MMMLALWFLAAFGFSFVVGHSKISLPFRELLGGWVESSTVNEKGEVLRRVVSHKAAVPVLGPFLVMLAECPGCLGWWLGFAAGAIGFVHVPLALAWWSWVGAALLLAFATSGANLLLAKYVGLV